MAYCFAQWRFFGLDIAVLLLKTMFSLEHLSQVDGMILYSFFL